MLSKTSINSLENRVLFISTLFFLFITSDLHPFIIPHAGHDEGLFFALARNIKLTGWLGKYNQLTLAKVPGYPIWLFLCNTFGLSEFRVKVFLYIFSSFFFSKVLSKFFCSRKKLSSSIIFILLLFNPIIFTNVFYRTTRDGVYISLISLIVACLINMYVINKKTSFIESFIFYFALFFSYLFREENVLILFLLFIFQLSNLFLYYGKSFFKELKKSDILELITKYSKPWLVLFLLISVISGVNYFKYGYFGINSRNMTEYKKAVGAIYRASYNQSERYLTVKQKDRELIYKNSPSFSLLKDVLDGTDARWKREIRNKNGKLVNDFGGWFEWAFKSAIQKKGLSSSLNSEREFLLKVSDEINQSCDKGLIETEIKQYRQVLPIYKNDYLCPLMSSILKGCHDLFLLDNISLYNQEYHFCDCDDSQWYVFSNFCNISPVPNRSIPNDHFSGLNIGSGISKMKLFLLEIVLFIYKLIVPFLCVCTLFSFLYLLIKYRSISKKILVTFVCLLAFIFLRIIVLAYIDVTMYSAVNNLYFLPIYPLFLAVIFIVPFYLINLFYNGTINSNALPK